MKKNLVVLSGAGISAESGVPTFRDANGLWENHPIEDVATPMGWNKNPELVLAFYNQRRKQLQDVKPNRAHEILVELETKFNVSIITQNVDGLHERAGSKYILHLHGELLKSRSSIVNSFEQEQTEDILLGDMAQDGSQLRPAIVWFGEDVPMLEKAAEWAEKADVFLIIGTSLQVYPAASLYEYAPEKAEIIAIDPSLEVIPSSRTIEYLNTTATEGMKKLWERWK